LATEVQGWQTADHDPSYLLRGARLTRFEEWVAQTTIALTQVEQTFLQASITARQQRQAEEEARQQRELETAHQLAATEHQRAQEQAQAAQNLRRRAVYLGVALIVAVALAVTALLFSHQSRQNAALAAAAAAEALTNADLAATREAEAVANAQAAATQEALAQQNASLAATQEAESNAQRILAEAEANTRATAEAVAIQEQAEAQRQAELAQARELAASGLVALEEDPERSILLALRSLDLVYTPEGEEMLRQSMMASRVRLTIPKTYQNLGEVIYSPDGSTLIGVEDDGSNSFITIWDATTGEILQSLSCNTTCTGGSFSSDGNLLAVGDNENNIVIVDLKASWAAGSIQIQHQLVGHTGELGYLVFSPDNTRLASTSWDKTLRLWDLMEGQLLYSIEEPGIQWLFTVPDFSPDGNLVTVSGFVPGTEVGTRVFDTNTGDLLLSLPTDQRWPSFTTDGTRLITRSSGDQRFYIWDVATSLATSNAQELYNFGRASTRPFGVNPTSPDNIYMTEEVNVDSDIVLWQLGENGATQAIRLSGHAPQFLVLTIFHPDGDRLATFGEDGIRVWDISPAGQREFLTYKAHESTVYYLALNQVGTQIATASFDGTAKLWSAESDVLLQEFIGHEAVLRTVDFSPDGLRLVTSSDDRTEPVCGTLRPDRSWLF